MKENYQEVKKTIYAAMSIYDLIKDVDISLENQIITSKDKKYLSLYLGIINTRNIVSDYLKSENINIGTFINFEYLKYNEYLEIYNKYFVEVFNEIDFISIESNFNFLLSKNVIKKFNETNGYSVDILFENISISNKEYIKS